MYALSSVLSRDPEKAFSSRLDQLLSGVCDQIPDLSCARRFFEVVQNWSEMKRDPRKARDAFALGIRALEAIEKWRASELKPL